MTDDVIQYINIAGTLICESNIYSCIDYLSQSNIELQSGHIYGFKGSIGSGNWGASTAICSLNSNMISFDCVLVNGIKTTTDEVLSITFDINKEVQKLCKSEHSVDDLIKEAINQGSSRIKEYDIINIFKLTKERYSRKPNEVGNEIYRIAIAIGFIGGKRIFVYPFISETYTHLIDITKCCFGYLKNSGCIIIIPYDRSADVNSIMDYIYRFKKTRVISIIKSTKLYEMQHCFIEILNELIVKLRNKAQRIKITR